MTKEEQKIDTLFNENLFLKAENQKLKLMLKNKPDNEITLQDDKGTKYTIIQTERIDMQEKLNKTIQELLSNWNKLKSWADYMRVNTLQQNNYGRILDKMQELESRNSDESN